MPGAFFRSPFWLKGRRHPSFRNDFNRQRLETARIATLSQQCFPTPEMENGAPANFSVSRDPPTMRRPGAGGCRATPGPKTELQAIFVLHKNDGDFLIVGPA